MPTPARRRRFQFRLRTLLVGFVLIGAALTWLGSRERIVIERKELVGCLLSQSDRCWASIKLGRQGWNRDEERYIVSASAEPTGYLLIQSGDAEKKPSEFRFCVLGDQSLDEISLNKSASASLLSEIKRLFPEATIRIKN